MPIVDCSPASPPEPQDQHRLSPITETSRPLTPQTPSPDGKASLIPVFVRRQPQDQAKDPPLMHGRVQPSSALSPALFVPPRPVTGSTGSAPRAAAPGRYRSPRVSPAPPPLAFKRVNSPTATGVARLSPNFHSNEEKAFRLERTGGAYKSQLAVDSHASLRILNATLVQEPTTLQTDLARPRAHSSLSYRDVLGTPPKVTETPRPRSAFSHSVPPASKPQRLLSVQLTRANSLLGAISRSSTPPHHKRSGVDESPPRSRTFDSIPPHGFAEEMAGNSPHVVVASVDIEDALRASSPGRRSSVRIASFLHRIGQDAARRLSKSPGPSPLSVMTHLPDLEGDLVGTSPIRTAIRCSGIFGVPDEPDAHPFRPLLGTHYRRRNSTGSIEEKPMRHSLYLKNGDAEVSLEDTPGETTLNRHASMAATLRSSFLSSPPELASSGSQGTPSATPPSLELSVGAATSPCATYPLPHVVEPVEELLQAAQLLREHSESLRTQSETLELMFVALRTSAQQSLEMSNRLLAAAEAAHSLAPSGHAVGQSPADTPRALPPLLESGSLGHLNEALERQACGDVEPSIPELQSRLNAVVEQQSQGEDGRSRQDDEGRGDHQAMESQDQPPTPSSAESSYTDDTHSQPDTACQPPDAQLPHNLSLDHLVDINPAPVSNARGDPTVQFPEADVPLDPNDRSQRGYRRKPPPQMELEPAIVFERPRPVRRPLPLPLSSTHSSLRISPPSPNGVMDTPDTEGCFLTPRSAPPIPNIPPASSSPAAPPSAFTPVHRHSYIKVSGNGHGSIFPNGNAVNPTTPPSAPPDSFEPSSSSEVPSRRSSLIRRVSWRRQPSTDESKGRGWFRRA